ncbi:MAG: hypothetical protein ABIJ05_01360 [Patescibacteria group bacterium]
MLKYIERELRNSCKDGLAQVISGVHATLGKDFSFPSSEQTVSLEDATREYKNNPNNPELLTQFMYTFWREAGQRIGKDYTVSKFSLKSKEIKERIKNGQMAIFVPDGLNRVDLGRMFPKMESWAVQEKNSAVDTVDNFGWLWIEASVDAQNRSTTQRQLEKKFKKEKKQGQSLRSYIVGGQISKLLIDKYFDEGLIWSILLGSCDEDEFIVANFFPRGFLRVSLYGGSPLGRPEDVYGRSEEVIKP